MPTTCEINFENYASGAIFAGEMLRGTVQLAFTSPKCVRGIYIQICGEAFAEWTPDRKKIAIAAQHVHLNERQCFVDGNTNVQIGRFNLQTHTAGKVDMKADTYNYPFECMLPSDLPSSIEGRSGSIRYFVRVIVDNTVLTNEIFKRTLNIIRPLDLNADLLYRKAIVVEKRKVFYPFGFICCYHSKPLHITVRMPVRAFIPGQSIDLDIIVNNRSNQSVYAFKVLLYKQIFYFIRTLKPKGVHQRTDVVFIAKQTTDGCDAKSYKGIHVDLKVPQLSPTDLTSSKIVKVKYLLRVMALVGEWHENPILELPITIGTHGFQNSSPPPPPPEASVIVTKC